VSVTVSGCAGAAQRGPRDVTPVAQVRDADHAPYRAPGATTITGQGFLRQQGGGVVTCAGSEVFLIPSTDYTREATAISMRGDRVVGPGPTAGTTGARRTQCDAQGKFRFEGVPGGIPWIIMTQVSWRVGYAPQGGALLRAFTPADRGTEEVMLTDQNFVGR
jgi:hypothetical protein